jgi:hypothetical protein
VRRVGGERSRKCQYGGVRMSECGSEQRKTHLVLGGITDETLVVVESDV